MFFLQEGFTYRNFCPAVSHGRTPFHHAKGLDCLLNAIFRDYPEEATSHRVALGAFWIDATPVTNRQFGFKPTALI
jgi:hypothetical protein